MSRCLLVALAALFTALACSATTPHPTPLAAAPASESLREEPPHVAALPEFVPPVAGRQVLNNGLTLLTLERRRLPIASAAIVIKSGAGEDPAALPGLAGFLAEALRAGTESRTADEIADELETRGATLAVSVDQDAMTLSFTTLTENFDAVLAVVADLLMHPAFKPEELERVRRKRLAALRQEQDDPSRIASRVFRAVLYGGHPYGHTALGKLEAITKLGRADLERFYAAHLRPANAALVIVGPYTGAEAGAKAEAQLGAWRGRPGVTAPPPAAVDGTPQIAVVDRPGAPQSEIRVGHLGLSRSHPDYFPVMMCNAILGGVFNSRINMNLREEKGITYGAFSSFELWRSRGVFGVGAGIVTKATATAVAEVIREIARMRDTDVGADELAGAKERYALSLPSSFENVNAIAGNIASLYLHDLPLDYFRTVAAEIRKVTVADVRRVAQAHLRPAQLSVVVVGDATAVAETLSILDRGGITHFDASGEIHKGPPSP
ncbi:MAG: insulinase family protein [Deltaproteobacteria bacterium]|nr:insulinase family protein [Deltaproteobacteria bacterium]